MNDVAATDDGVWKARVLAATASAIDELKQADQPALRSLVTDMERLHELLERELAHNSDGSRTVIAERAQRHP